MIHAAAPVWLTVAFLGFAVVTLQGARMWRYRDPELSWACLGLAGLAAFLGGFAGCQGLRIIFG